MGAKVVRELFEWLKAFAIAAIVALIIIKFLFAVVSVKGPSMEPTLYTNERLILNKIIYNFSTPKHGEIVVFHANESDDYIKRVIGLPGDEIKFQNNKLFINGQPVDEPYLEDIYTRDFGPVIVPDNELFVLGDNRLNSTDSRILGAIPMEKVVGRVNLRIWPLNKISIVK